MNMGAWVESEILKFLLHNVDLEDIPQYLAF